MRTPQRPAEPPVAADPGWDDERLKVAFSGRAARAAVPADLTAVAVERLRPTARWSPWARLLPAGAGLVLVLALVGGGIATLGGPAGLLGSGAVTFRDGPTPDRRTLDGAEYALDFPASWLAYTATAVAGSGGSIDAVLTTQPIEERCDGLEGVDVNCVYEQRLEPGQLRIFVGNGSYRAQTVLDRADIENGSTTRLAVGGMPAILDEFDDAPDDYYLADQSATWAIATPTSLARVIRIEFMAREPAVDAARAAVETLVASFRFTRPPTPLPDDPEAGIAAARAVLDAEAASFRTGFVPENDAVGRTYLDCLGPVPGRDRVVDVRYGPGGDLGRAVSTRCRWFVSPVRNAPFWHLATVHQWTRGTETGWYGARYYIDAAGTVVARTYSGEVPPAEDLGDDGVKPAASCDVMPEETPISCASIGRLGDQASAGVDQARIWLTSLGAVRSTMDPAQQTSLPPDDSRVWVMVFDGEWRCCPNAFEENGQPIPATDWTRWLVVAEADREGTGFVYLQDWSDRPVPERLPTPTPPAPPSTVPTWGPWPPEGAQVIELPSENGDDPGRVAVVDLSGALVGVRAPTQDGGDTAGLGEGLLRDPTGDNRYRLRWSTFACEREMTVTIHADVQRIVVEPAPRGGCDSIGIGRELVLEFSRDVDPGDVEFLVSPAVRLPEPPPEPMVMTVDLIRADTIDRIVVTDYTGSLMEARPAVLAAVPVALQIAPGTQLARVADGGTVVLWDGGRCDSDFSITIEADDLGPPERIIVRSTPAQGPCRMALIRRAVWLDLGPVNVDAIAARHDIAAAPDVPDDLLGLDVIDVEAALAIRALPDDDREIAVRGWLWRLNPATLDCLVFERIGVEEFFFGQGCRSDSLMATEDGTFDGPTLALALGQAVTSALPYGRRVEVVLVGHFDDRRSSECTNARVAWCADMFWVDAVSIDGELTPRDWIGPPLGSDTPAPPIGTADDAAAAVLSVLDGPRRRVAGVATVISVGLIPGGDLTDLEPALRTTCVSPCDLLVQTPAWIWHVTVLDHATSGVRTFVINDAEFGDDDPVVIREPTTDGVVEHIVR